MQWINVNGFLNSNRYRKILIWRKQDVGKWTNIVFSGEVLDNFSIKKARKRSTKTGELETNKEVYCCDSIYLEFNKSNKRLIKLINDPDFNIFEIGFKGYKRMVKKYHILFRTMNSHWRECTTISSTGDKILIELKDFNCEQYLVLKNALRENDLLVIKSIDRLGRNYNMIINEWRDITLNIKADIKVIDMPLLDTTKHKDLLGNFISDLILQVLSYVAEQERTFIRQRQREGIDIAKSKGVKFGRKRIEYPSNWNEVIYKWKNNEITARKSMELLGLKQTTFYKLVREEK